MLGNLTAGKAGSEANDKMALEIIIAADKLRLELAQLADDDAAVFNKFMEAYKMPKTTDTEKAMRTAAIGQAAIAAAEVPMQIADKSLEVLKLARKLISCSATPTPSATARYPPLWRVRLCAVRCTT